MKDFDVVTGPAPARLKPAVLPLQPTREHGAPSPRPDSASAKPAEARPDKPI
jgi:hypothetical protein